MAKYYVDTLDSPGYTEVHRVTDEYGEGQMHRTTRGRRPEPISRKDAYRIVRAGGLCVSCYTDGGQKFPDEWLGWTPEPSRGGTWEQGYANMPRARKSIPTPTP